MPKVRITPTNNHVVYCENEDELFDTMHEFESYLMENGMKHFVQMGSVYLKNFSFEFRITTEEEKEKEIIYSFFKMEKPVSYSKYRILVKKKERTYYYPLNDLKTALLLFKVMELELGKSANMELVIYSPHAKGDWIVWKDKQGKRARELQLQIINEEIIVDFSNMS